MMTSRFSESRIIVLSKKMSMNFGMALLTSIHLQVPGRFFAQGLM